MEEKSLVSEPSVVRIPGDQARSIDPFFLARTPVTNRQYASFLESGGAAPPPPPWWSDAEFSRPGQPVVGVTWEEASAYASWLSRAAGGTWRLPTEIEWEHAMSGGLAGPRTAWGEAVPAGEIPEGPLSAPWEVGRGTPNGFGVLDPGTIVHEWCLDWRVPESPSPGSPARRASRGGSWRHEIRWSAPSAKSSLPPGFRYSDYGFRVLREFEP